jgi:cyclic peptide transporter
MLLLVFVLSCFWPPQWLNAAQAEIENKVRELMDEGDIPGLCLVIVRKDEPLYIKGFGFADGENQAVNESTLFELGSTSKAFTALAALKCSAEGLLDLDAPVSRYLPWFYVNYEGEKMAITIRQLLHQTSGIPTRTLGDIPAGSEDNALEQTVRKIVGMELDHEPGNRFIYATINYDIVGAVIEAATGMSYEDYIAKEILAPLQMNGTRAGIVRLDPASDKGKMARGHKIGFFTARPYEPPVFRGNTPAGYILSNGGDMARWLKAQLGLEESALTPMIKQSHLRDRTVPPNPATLLSYAMGWRVSLDGSEVVLHDGKNPSFSSYVIFKPSDGTGVAVLANSNSNYTPFIGLTVMNHLYGKETPMPIGLADGMDKSSSMVSIILCLYLLVVLLFLLSVVLHIKKGKRRFQPLGVRTLLRWIVTLVVMAPFVLAIYLLPRALAGLSWETAVIWGPSSFKLAVMLLLAAMAASYFGYLVSSLFPLQNKYFRSIPMLILMSIGGGMANAVVIFLISISLFSPTPLKYLLFYFFLAALVYVTGRKVLQTRLTKIAHDIIYDLRIQLVEKLFLTSYQKFEKLDSGRLFTTINNDTGQIGAAAAFLVSLISSLVTVLGAFIYLATIAFWATLVTLGMVGVIAVVYYFVSQKANVYLNAARDTQNAFMNLVNGLSNGYKELSLHASRKTAFQTDMETVSGQFKRKFTISMIKFVNAFMVGESLLIVVLASVGFIVPVLFPQIKVMTLMGFIMVLLYLIGPVNSILRSIPGIMQVRISWLRIRGLMRDIPANMTPEELALPAGAIGSIASIELNGVTFQYKSEEESERFSVGPVDIKIAKGETVFIIGGNGSGKTTLAKLLTGLYIPDKGTITVDGNEISNHRLGEYFSVVFSDFYLFEKLYDVDLAGKQEEVDRHLELLRLREKVSLDTEGFSTLDLSGGQRKRLALLQCYLEDRPVYLFDEVAADQDPEFRKFFYRQLLPKMKEEGKIVIAITHDDHYFDVADRVIKMNMGQVEHIGDGKDFRVTN